MLNTSFSYSYCIANNGLHSSNFGHKVCFHTAKTNCPHWFRKGFPRTKIVIGPRQPNKRSFLTMFE